ncbi:MAG: Spy/CpxP family protein refolding chaperone [Rhodoferax sp.]|nr:Spy/CpxP family protein refolding chaperone [Rhodoferax sp.]
MKNFLQRNLKRALFGVCGAALVLGGLTACGHRHTQAGEPLSAEQYAQKRDKLVDRVAGRLDLSEDQKKRLGTLGDKLYEQRTALIGASKDPRSELKGLVAGDKFDATRAQALITEKTTLLQTRSPEVLAALADFYNSLNPTQQQKVRDHLDGRHGWWHRG